ncbi:unnamed protein product [Amoebophrya sp. A120]|nr:unnamed protein product [Amoebophrya sp. A120]|eukprot:GSA120T00017065001.1
MRATTPASKRSSSPGGSINPRADDHHLPLEPVDMSQNIANHNSDMIDKLAAQRQMLAAFSGATASLKQKVNDLEQKNLSITKNCNTVKADNNVLALELKQLQDTQDTQIESVRIDLKQREKRCELLERQVERNSRVEEELREETIQLKTAFEMERKRFQAFQLNMARNLSGLRALLRERFSIDFDSTSFANLAKLPRDLAVISGLDEEEEGEDTEILGLGSSAASAQAGSSRTNKQQINYTSRSNMLQARNMAGAVEGTTSAGRAEIKSTARLMRSKIEDCLMSLKPKAAHTNDGSGSSSTSLAYPKSAVDLVEELTRQTEQISRLEWELERVERQRTDAQKQAWSTETTMELMKSEKGFRKAVEEKCRTLLDKELKEKEMQQRQQLNEEYARAAEAKLMRWKNQFLDQNLTTEALKEKKALEGEKFAKYEQSLIQREQEVRQREIALIKEQQNYLTLRGMVPSNVVANNQASSYNRSLQAAKRSEMTTIREPILKINQQTAATGGEGKDEGAAAAAVTIKKAPAGAGAASTPQKPSAAGGVVNKVAAQSSLSSSIDSNIIERGGAAFFKTGKGATTSAAVEQNMAPPSREVRPLAASQSGSPAVSSTVVKISQPPAASASAGTQKNKAQQQRPTTPAKTPQRQQAASTPTKNKPTVVKSVTPFQQDQRPTAPHLQRTTPTNTPPKQVATALQQAKAKPAPAAMKMTPATTTTGNRTSVVDPALNNKQQNQLFDFDGAVEWTLDDDSNCSVVYNPASSPTPLGRMPKQFGNFNAAADWTLGSEELDKTPVSTSSNKTPDDLQDFSNSNASSGIMVTSQASDPLNTAVLLARPSSAEGENLFEQSSVAESVATSYELVNDFESETSVLTSEHVATVSNVSGGSARK